MITTMTVHVIFVSKHLDCPVVSYCILRMSFDADCHFIHSYFLFLVLWGSERMLISFIDFIDIDG